MERLDFLKIQMKCECKSPGCGDDFNIIQVCHHPQIFGHLICNEQNCKVMWDEKQMHKHLKKIR